VTRQRLSAAVSSSPPTPQRIDILQFAPSRWDCFVGITFAQLRDLDTSKLTTAADSAVSVGKDMESRAGDVVDAAEGSQGSDFWGGADAEAQNALLNTFPAPLNAAGSVFKSAGGTIDTLVTELEAA